jgi:hypothetical protein
MKGGKKMGYIYILTNPSFPAYVKIGFAEDVDQRLAELNRSSAVPFAFRIYATYEVDSKLSDKKLHSILDKLNPDLRSKEDVNGKRRIREFYAMSPQDAYEILKAIAEINNSCHRLNKRKITEAEKREDEIVEEINEEHQERMSRFEFSQCGIKIGEKIEFCCKGNDNSGVFCEVVDDRQISYNGEIWSLTALAKYFLGRQTGVAGPRYFKYKGKWLNELRD